LAVNGKDQGAKREFTFDGLDQLAPKLATFDVTVPPDRTERREILLLPRERVVLPVVERSTAAELVPQLGHASGVKCLVFSPDGRYLYSGADGGVVLWEVKNGRELRRFVPRNRRMATSLRFDTSIVAVTVSPDGRRRLAGATDDCAYTWDVASGNLLNSDAGLMGNHVVAVSRDGRFYALGRFGGGRTVPVIVMNAENHDVFKLMAHREKESTYTVNSGLGFTPDGSKIVSAGYAFAEVKGQQASDFKEQTKAAFKNRENLLWVWTPNYMAPEQVRGEAHRLDGRTDVWALGVILYERLCGRLPLRGCTRESLFDEILNREPKPARQVNDHVSRELERISLKCLAKRMSDRYLTACRDPS
jgi:hypothetical protein